MNAQNTHPPSNDDIQPHVKGFLLKFNTICNDNYLTAQCQTRAISAIMIRESD